jgi:hypothetical protein
LIPSSLRRKYIEAGAKAIKVTCKTLTAIPKFLLRMLYNKLTRKEYQGSKDERTSLKLPEGRIG